MRKTKVIFRFLIIMPSLLFLSSCATYETFKPPTEWETYKMNENEIYNYLSNNYQTNHFIEGIWQVTFDFTMHSYSLNRTASGYNAHKEDIAIIRENIYNPNENKYLIVMMHSADANWDYPGRIRGTIYRINSNTYSVKWYNEHYNLVQSNFHINYYGELYGTLQYVINNINMTRNYTFIKSYPQN